jgi:hypothetical protein
MLCLIVVFVIMVDHRPSSIVHRLSSFVSLPLLVVSIHRPLSAVMSPPFLPPFLLNIVTIAIAGLKVDYCVYWLTAVALVILHVCGNGSVVVFIIIIVMSVVVVY